MKIIEKQLFKCDFCGEEFASKDCCEVHEMRCEEQFNCKHEYTYIEVTNDHALVKTCVHCGTKIESTFRDFYDCLKNEDMKKLFNKVIKNQKKQGWK